MELEIEEVFILESSTLRQTYHDVFTWCTTHSIVITQERKPRYLQGMIYEVANTQFFTGKTLEITLEEADSGIHIKFDITSTEDIHPLIDEVQYVGNAYRKIESLLNHLGIQLSPNDIRRFYTRAFIMRHIRSNWWYWGTMILMCSLMLFILLMIAMNTGESLHDAGIVSLIVFGGLFAIVTGVPIVTQWKWMKRFQYV